MLPLKTDGELLVLHVGSDVVHLDGVTHEVGPGPTDVVGGFFELFVHETMMAPQRRFWGKWWTPAQLSQPLSFDTISYQQKYNATKP